MPATLVRRLQLVDYEEKMYKLQDLGTKLCQTARFRIHHPMIYGDGIMRITIWRWEDQQWRATLNGRKPQEGVGYDTYAEAVEAVLGSLNDLAELLSGVKAEHLSVSVGDIDSRTSKTGT